MKIEKVFDSHSDDHKKAGLFLKDMWQDVNDPNDVFFNFEVRDKTLALKFIGSPDSAKVGEESGVIDGE